ncbi:hypothetical protein BGZ93_002141 [Podila epicladia]|nr:hypothetical protein BGZ93_002141 [Podila epicladia]
MTLHFNESLPKTHPTGHVFRKGLCVTGGRAHNFSPLEHRIGTHGLIPLWEKDVTLRYRFNQHTLRQSGKSKEDILTLFNKGVKLWGDAVPVKFIEDEDAWDFEFVVRNSNECSEDGCVLASAFFPGGGQQQFVIYPIMFSQSKTEQKEAVAHELGHVFGLRHWFAKDVNKASGWSWRSEVFGSEDPVTIMNCNEMSTLTEADKEDLKELYRQARSGVLKHINRTPIVLFKPFSAHAPHLCQP